MELTGSGGRPLGDLLGEQTLLALRTGKGTLKLSLEPPGTCGGRRAVSTSATAFGSASPRFPTSP